MTIQGHYRKLHWRVNGIPILDHACTDSANQEVSGIVASHLHSKLNAQVGTHDHARDWAIEGDTEAGRGIEAYHALSTRILKPMAGIGTPISERGTPPVINWAKRRPKQ
jgi:hypothetical protein